MKIRQEFYEKGKISDTPFGVITLFHVLEHIYTPKILLKNLIEDNLKESGIFVIEVPNFESLQSKIAAAKWLHLDIPRHINHFKFDILKKMIEDIGGRIIKVEYYHTVHGILGMVSSLLNVLGYSKNIMSELKYRRTVLLIFMIVVTLPVATLFEIIASLLKKGAVLRIYATINK